MAELAGLPQRKLVTREVDDVSVILYRHGDEVDRDVGALPAPERPARRGRGAGDRRARLRGLPLARRAFRLNGGEVVHGPSATDQQILPTRIVDGTLQTRLP